MFLIQQGVPWQAVFGDIRRPMSATRRKAFVIAAGELLGGEYDWHGQRWRPPRRG